MTENALFAIRTGDAAWIERNGATVREDGWVMFSAPVSGMEVVTFCRNDWIRYRLPDLPSDWANPYAMTPAVKIAETAELLGASTELSADTKARMAEVAAWKAGVA